MKTKISIISFTGRGVSLSLAVGQKMKKKYDCILYTKYSGSREPGIVYVTQNVVDWAGTQFQENRALLFIGACGIAVRSIAPWAADKLTDSPVLVMDEMGRFVIPILSGHYGGANKLAEQIAEKLGAVPVITTATDVNRLFAVDVFAKNNGLVIGERTGIAKVSAALLRTGHLTMSVEDCDAGTTGAAPAAIAGRSVVSAGDHDGCGKHIRGVVPGEVKLVPYPPAEPVDVLVAVGKPEHAAVKLHLIPKAIVLGMGCRRGKSADEIESFVLSQLEKQRIPIEAVEMLATIDRKKDERGLLKLAEKYKLRFVCFSAEELARVPGKFAASGFVNGQVGVDNVCERAAVAAARVRDSERTAAEQAAPCRLLVTKTAQDGMTLAVAEREWSVYFDEA